MADPSTYRPAPGSIPTSPGVYRFRDEHRPRGLRRQGEEPPGPADVVLPGHRQPAPAHRHDGDHARRASSGRWSNTEVEALQLEYSWIKEFDPRFNVKYRDDKSYPWLAVTLNEEFPRVMVGRGAKKQRRPLLRPLLPRLGDPRDRRPAAAGLPDALVLQRRLQAVRADRPALPARLHRQVLRALRRPGHRRGAPRDRRRLLRLHGRPDRRRS